MKSNKLNKDKEIAKENKLNAKKKVDKIMINIRKGLRKGGIVDEELVKNLIKYGKDAGVL